MVDSKIQHFEQLIAWQKAQDLAVDVYKLTKDFPSEKRFALIDQLRRSVSSVSANITEGFGRRSSKDKLHFYAVSYGSLLETKNFLYLAERLNYVSPDTNKTAIENVTNCQKILNALIRSIHDK